MKSTNDLKVGQILTSKRFGHPSKRYLLLEIHHHNFYGTTLVVSILNDDGSFNPEAPKEGWSLRDDVYKHRPLTIASLKKVGRMMKIVSWVPA